MELPGEEMGRTQKEKKGEVKGEGKAVLYFPANEVEILNAVERCIYLMRHKENQENEVVGNWR